MFNAFLNKIKYFFFVYSMFILLIKHEIKYLFLVIEYFREKGY